MLYGMYIYMGVMVERYEVWVYLGHVYGLFAEFHTNDSVLDDT